jgi:hypothetical protein
MLVADTILFKNGAYIEVDKASEKDGQIEYWMGSTTYTIPKTKVEKIVEGGGPSITLGSQAPVNLVPPSSADAASEHSSSIPLRAATASKHAKIPVSTPSVPGDDSYWSHLRAQIVNRDHVDERALSALESQANPDETQMLILALACSKWSVGIPRARARTSNMHSASRPTKHRSRRRGATRKLPPKPNISLRLSQIRHKLFAGWQRRNITPTAPATPSAPGSARLELEPNPETQRLLARAQRELDVEERSNQQESRHFSLRYEGGETSLALQRELLGTLEEQYQQLARDLDYSPRENMVVTLYTQKQFFNITEVPSWAGGLNDGKLRIPIQGVTSMTPELQRVLKHELTHSFVRFMVGDRCPSWLNQGLGAVDGATQFVILRRCPGGVIRTT